MYGTTFEPTDTDYGLVSIDENTGLATFIGEHLDTSDIPGAAYDSLNDVLYGSDSDAVAGPSLATIDRTTGVSTPVGLFVNDYITGLTYDPVSNILYGVAPGGLYTIDRVTGEATLVGVHGLTWPFEFSSNGLAIDPDTGIMYLVDGASSILYTVNKGSGLATPVGPTGLNTPASLAVIPDPVPGVGIVVNTDADSEIESDSLCTLREAINNANANVDLSGEDCATGGGADTISFVADYTITLGSALPDISESVTIAGKGVANTVVQASTCNPVTLPDACTPATWRVFTFTSGTSTLQDLTVQHGRCAGACFAKNHERRRYSQ